MRPGLKKLAMVGGIDAGLADALREAGYRAEPVEAESAVALALAVRRMKPALIHAREAHLKVAVVGRLIGAPVLLHVSGSQVSGSVARAARLAGRTLCGGAAAREALLALGAPASTTGIIRGLLELRPAEESQIFPPMLDPSLRWLVSASPIDVPDRGVSDLVLAFLSLARSRPELKLLLNGQGAAARQLQAQAEHAGLRGRVVIQPLQRAQLTGVFAHAAAVVAPSRSGTLPDAVPEALAAGGRVVATAVGPHPTWIREGRTGWLVPARAPVALAARLAQVLADPSWAERVGREAQRAAAEACAPRALAMDLARCYAALSRLERPSRSAFLPSLPEPARMRI